jgi:hypothetical protein
MRQWTNPLDQPNIPRACTTVLDQGTAAQLSATRQSWEEYVLTYLTFNMVQQALNKKSLLFLIQ